jgi:hypothetical protein
MTNSIPIEVAGPIALLVIFMMIFLLFWLLAKYGPKGDGNHHSSYSEHKRIQDKNYRVQRDPISTLLSMNYELDKYLAKNK